MHASLPQLLVSVALVGAAGCARQPASDRPEVRTDTAPTTTASGTRPTRRAAAFTPAEEQVVAGVRDLGGRVFVDERSDGTPVVAVYLSRSQAKDDDLKPLHGLRYLAFLHLEDALITDAGMGAVGELTDLQGLDLGYTHITDAGLASLAPLRRLRFLTLTNTATTDDGMKHLAAMAELRKLRVGFTRITDASLTVVRGLTHLEELDLAATSITDAGLDQLQALTALRQLTLDETKTTPAGVNRLARALPQLRISR